MEKWHFLISHHAFSTVLGVTENEQFQNIPIFLVDFKLLKYHNYR